MATTENTPTPATNAWLSHLALVALILYFAYLYSGIIFTTQGVTTERDSFYHARYSQMFPERGLSRELRWMQFTEWKDRFCDKDFLYHVYLAAFTRDAREPLPGAKSGTLALFMAALGALYFVLRQWKAPYPLIWAALLAVCSANFMTRMFMVRSHTFSVVLMIFAMHFILRRRFWPCFAMAFLYAWSYSVPLAMLIAACTSEAGRFVVERKWKAALIIPAATAAGLCAGLLIHPYTPHSLRSIWMFFEIIRAGATGSEVELGSEFRHMALDTAFSVSIGSSVAVIAAVIGALVLWLRGVKGRTLSPETAAVVTTAAAWFCSMFGYSERLIEYAAPLACIACGFVARDLWGEMKPLATLKGNARSIRLAFLGLGVAVLVALHSFTYGVTRDAFVLNSLPPPPQKGAPQEQIEHWYRGRYFDGAAEWMRKNLKSGTVVANFHWDDFPELFYCAPEMNYLVGLDPTFMRLPYPEKARALEEMRIKDRPPGTAPPPPRAPLDFHRIGDIFGTRYTIMRRTRAARYGELIDADNRRFKSDAAGAKLVFEDREAVIYELK